MNTQETWGRIYALMDHLTPGGLPDVAINDAAQAPGLHFASHRNNVSRHIADDEIIDKRMRELMAQLPVDALQAYHEPVEHGSFMLGFYCEKSTLPPAREERRDD